MDEKNNNIMTNELHILSVLKEIRQLLYIGGLKEIGLDFPVLFMHNIDSMEHLNSIFYEENKEYMGFCDVKYFDWTISETNSHVKISQKYKVGRIVMRIYNNTKQLISMANIISVYLHELAHSITIGVCIYNKNVSKWIELEHPKEFYVNYQRVLVLAEKLNIFTLGKMKDKYSMRNLKRFDNIDTTYIQLAKHCSIKYKHLKTENKSNDDEDANGWDENCDVKTIRLTVMYHKQQKLIIIKHNEWIANKQNICHFNGFINKIYSKFPQLKKRKSKKNRKNTFNLTNEDSDIKDDKTWLDCIVEASNRDGVVEIKIQNS